MTFLFGQRNGFTWAPYKQKKYKVVAEESVQRVLSIKIVTNLIADWSNVFCIFMMNSADLRRLFVILRCLLLEYDV